MKKGFFLMIVSGGLIAALASSFPPLHTAGVENAIAFFKKESGSFVLRASELEKSIRAISVSVEKDKNSKAGNAEDSMTIVQAKRALFRCRLQYKRIEFFLQYFFPGATAVYNMPDRVEVEEPELEYTEPTGLQVIEDLLFAQPVLSGKTGANQKQLLIQQASLISSSAGDLGSLLYKFKADDRQVLESLRLELIRVMTLGITGFDTPLSKTGISESAAALRSMQEVLQPYLIQSPKGSSDALVDSIRFYMERSLKLLEEHTDFDSFDRMGFLICGAMPLQQYTGAYIREMGLELNTHPALNDSAKNIFCADAFNLNAFPHTGADNKKQAAVKSSLAELGRRLFFEKALSRNHLRNCASCHQPEKYFTDGLPLALAYDGHSRLKRNAPTLLYAAFQYNQFLDGRATSLEDQVKDVMHNPAEMNADDDSVCRWLENDSAYRLLFKKAFGENAISVDRIAEAIAAFVRVLAPFNSGFDRYISGDRNAMSPSQLRGFNLFMGKAQCGTCHFAPLFNGLAPPFYDLTEFEILDVPATEDFSNVKPDADSGRYAVYPVPYNEGAFKTPTVRNSAVTAPYMHHGAFSNLEKVLDFYDKGGGAGLGLKNFTQTLYLNPLKLKEPEKRDIIAFLQSLTDRPVKRN